MYNEELKNRFLDTYSSETAKIYKDSLMKISESEEFFNKDIFNFTYEQLDGAFKSISSKTLSGVRRIISPTLEYIRWANQNGYVKTKIDITNLFMGDILKTYVWKHAQDNSYITREEMYDICDYLVNDVDKAIVVLAFEGVDNREHFEMTNLKFSDVDFATGKIKINSLDGSKREIILTHKKSLDILFDAKNQSTYLFGNGDDPKSKKNEYDLLDTPYFIRKIGRSKNVETINEEPVTSNYVISKITRFFKGKRSPQSGVLIEEPFLSGCEFLNINNLFKSGFFDYCMEIENEKGELTTADFRGVCVRYGINPKLLQSYKIQYLTWKENLKK